MTQSASYGLNLPSRAVCSLQNPEEDIFVAASFCRREQNEVHFIEFNPVSTSIHCRAVLSHPKAIWCVLQGPSTELLAVGEEHGALFDDALLRRLEADNLDCAGGANHRGALYSIGRDGYEFSLSLKAIVFEPKTAVRSTFWASDASRVGFATDAGVQVFDPAAIEKGAVLDLPGASVAHWDPLHPHNILVGRNDVLSVFDTRRGGPALEIASAHSGARVLDVDHNPFKPNFAASAGGDGSVVFWDLRRPEQSLRLANAHRHWAVSLCFNRLYDDLILSSGTDGVVNLWNVPPAVVAAQRSVDELEESIKPVYAHGDSTEPVYRVAWGASDAFLYTAVAMDGQVLFAQVDEAQKSKSLNLDG